MPVWRSSKVGLDGMQLLFRFVHGDTLGPWDFEPHMLVDDVAYRVKSLTKPTEPVYARFLSEGSFLSSGQKLSETALKERDVVETVWAPALPLEEQGNDRWEVLPRRLRNSLKLDTDPCSLDVSGVCKLEQHLQELARCFTPALQVLDIRQCGLPSKVLQSLFAQLPPSLKELKASRNFIAPPVLECLCDRRLNLRVLDIGCSHCKDCSSLMRVGGIVDGTLEELGVGDLTAVTHTLLAGILVKCPRLKLIDISCNHNSGFANEAFRSMALHCPLLEAVYAYRVEPEVSVINDFLSRCQNLSHFEVSGISAAETVLRMADISSLRSVRLELSSSSQDMIAALCSLNVQTLFLQFGVEDDSDNDDDNEFPLDLCTNPQDIAEAFGKSKATCFSLIVAGVEPVVLQAVGSRLYELGPGTAHGEGYSILNTLVQVPSCCVNLVRLSINFYEQIDAATLAAVAEMCPLLKDVQLNADAHDFQKTPIDKGVLALGHHCHDLEHLDSWKHHSQV